MYVKDRFSVRLFRDEHPDAASQQLIRIRPDGGGECPGPSTLVLRGKFENDVWSCRGDKQVGNLLL